MALSEYNYQIEYLPGKSNLLGDALSRLVAIETEHIADGTRPRQTAELASLFPEVHSEIAWQASQGLNLKNSKRILAAFNNKHEIELQRRLL